MQTQLILVRTESGCAALIVNQVVVAEANTSAAIDKLVTTAGRQLSEALQVPLVECQVEVPAELDGKWEWPDLLALLPARAYVRSIEAAEAALKAHQSAMGVEGDADIQLWQLLASLLEHTAARGLDFDKTLSEVKESIAAGEIELPAYVAQLKQKLNRD
jgi:hypothetical protein